MSGTETLQMDGPWWSPIAGVLELGLFVLLCWAVIHAPLIWRRGRAHRARIRNARHARRRTPLVRTYR